MLQSTLHSAAPYGNLAVFVDASVAQENAGLLERVAQAVAEVPERRWQVTPRMVPGGEQAKIDPSLIDTLLSDMQAARLCRQSCVLVIGGGAVLDAVGYAAALVHRGVRLVRVPSTTLAQGDSGVGVKNGVNAFGVKNYLGMFAPPWAVLNDEALLATLSARDWRSGFSEAVKVALLKDAAFFDQIERHAARIAAREEAAALPVIRTSALLHRAHILSGADAFEQGTSRPLDFGHWAAHKLEVLSGFELRHGEAVAIGISLDLEYAALAGFCRRETARRVQRCLLTLGFTLSHPLLERGADLRAGLEEFREHLGGPLCIPLITDIGRPVEVEAIDFALLARAADNVRNHLAK